MLYKIFIIFGIISNANSAAFFSTINSTNNQTDNDKNINFDIDYDITNEGFSSDTTNEGLSSDNESYYSCEYSSYCSEDGKFDYSKYNETMANLIEKHRKELEQAKYESNKRISIAQNELKKIEDLKNSEEYIKNVNELREKLVLAESSFKEFKRMIKNRDAEEWVEKKAKKIREEKKLKESLFSIKDKVRKELLPKKITRLKEIYDKAKFEYWDYREKFNRDISKKRLNLNIIIEKENAFLNNLRQRQESERFSLSQLKKTDEINKSIKKTKKRVNEKLKKEKEQAEEEKNKSKNNFNMSSSEVKNAQKRVNEKIKKAREIEKEQCDKKEKEEKINAENDLKKSNVGVKNAKKRLNEKLKKEREEAIAAEFKRAKERAEKDTKIAEMRASRLKREEERKRKKKEEQKEKKFYSKTQGSKNTQNKDNNSNGVLYDRNGITLEGLKFLGANVSFNDFNKLKKNEKINLINSCYKKRALEWHSDKNVNKSNEEKIELENKMKILTNLKLEVINILNR